MLKQTGEKVEIKFGEIRKEDDTYLVNDMTKDGDVLSVKTLEDIFDGFVGLNPVNIKIEYINKVED